MDRQIERVNQELNQFLCLFVNKQQNNWYDLLPIAEFQHNNHVVRVTGVKLQEIPQLIIIYGI